MRFKLKTFFSQKKNDSLRSKSLMLFICFLLASTFSMYAQTKSISGTITDETKEPLIGVTVRVKGTTVGTVTDFDGKYTISANLGDVLEYSFVGMTPQAVKVGSQNTIDIVLQDDAVMLSEMVVIGYGVQKKADLTGSIGSVNAEAIMKQPALNPLQSVQGRIAGVNITNNDAPGGNPTVVIRGLGTALGGRDPLYIVDGFPVDNINNISPADIVSMDILKDASSASIYGLRAANGVILITTKQGQSGASKIGVESFVGVKTIARRVEMANASQYVNYFNENVRATNPLSTQLLRDGSEQRYDTDWYDELLKTGFFTNNTVSLSGGSKPVDYFLSFNYYNEKGLLEGQRYDRSTIRNNNIYKFFDDRLKFMQNLNITFTNEKPKGFGNFNTAYRQSPLVPVMFPNGKYGTAVWNTGTGLAGYEKTNPTDDIANLNTHGNPVFQVDNQNELNKTLTLQGGLEAEFKVTDYLKVNTRLGATRYYENGRNFSDLRRAWLAKDVTNTDAVFDAEREKNPAVTQWANNSLLLRDIDDFRWTWEGFATFNKSFDKHNLQAVLGTSRERMNIRSTSNVTVYDVPAQEQYWSGRFSSTKISPLVEQYYETARALASYFGRVQYNFDSKYYFSGTVRRDGSSVFRSTGEYWGTFPSVGLGWTISQEEFLKDNSFIDHLKLKATWGILGNQNIPANANAILTASGRGGGFNSNYIFGPDQAINSGAIFGSPAQELGWEKTREAGLGIDFSLLHQRLSGSVDYYDKLNRNAIIFVTPIFTSAASQDYYQHAGQISNKGVEILLTWQDKFANGISYQVSANYSYNKNRVEGVKPGLDGLTGGSLGNGEITKRFVSGQPVFAWWMYETDGVWQTQEEIDANPHISAAKPGHLKYKDVDENGVIDDRDRKYFGSYMPTSNFGINITVGYKDFDVSLYGYGVAGNKVYNGLKSARFGGENIAADTYNNRWTGPNSTNIHPGANKDIKPSNYYLEDGSFFRLNNMTLGYTLNDKIFKGSKLRVYTTAQNLFVITGYSGFSPELSGNGNPRELSGVELDAYPTTRNFILGFNLQF